MPSRTLLSSKIYYVAQHLIQTRFSPLPLYSTIVSKHSTLSLRCRYVYLEIFRKFKWNRVASLTLDGHKYSEYISHLQDHLQTNGINFIMNRKFPTESPDMSMVRVSALLSRPLTCVVNLVTYHRQYLKDLKDRGARIIIGEFFERAGRVIMCEAYKQQMTQKQGYVWFLPGWYKFDWYDVDAIRRNQDDDEFTPNCTTYQMQEVRECDEDESGVSLNLLL